MPFPVVIEEISDLKKKAFKAIVKEMSMVCSNW